MKIKTEDKPIFRGKNICADVSNLDKLDLINISYNNPDKYDFKMCEINKHPLWDEYIISLPLLKFWKNIKKNNVDINKFRKYFNINNFSSFDYIFDHKYIVTVGSAKNRKWYLSNSCILEYKFKNKEFFHEDIFNDMENIIYFTENDIDEKLKKLKDNNYQLTKDIIEKRKEIFMKYLDYNNLVKWYGLFLLEYQKLF